MQPLQPLQLWSQALLPVRLLLLQALAPATLQQQVCLKPLHWRPLRVRRPHHWRQCSGFPRPQLSHARQLRPHHLRPLAAMARRRPRPADPAPQVWNANWYCA